MLSRKAVIAGGLTAGAWWGYRHFYIASSHPVSARLASPFLSPSISYHHINSPQHGQTIVDTLRRIPLLGVGYIEFDVRRTLDGTLVVWHDDHLPNGQKLHSATLAAYRSAASNQAVTVAELIAMLPSALKLHVDLKEQGYEQELITVLLQTKSYDDFVVTSLEPDTIRTIKNLNPNIRCGLSLGQQLQGKKHALMLWVRLNEMFPTLRLRNCPADFLAVHHRLASVSVLRYCRKHNFPAWVWTVDDIKRMHSFFDCPEVEVVVTNQPTLAITANPHQPPQPNPAPTHSPNLFL